MRVLLDAERRHASPGERDYRRVLGGMLVQDRDADIDDREGMEVVCGEPTEDDWGELLFAWRVCKHGLVECNRRLGRAADDRDRDRSDEPCRRRPDRAREGTRARARAREAPPSPQTRSSRSPTGHGSRSTPAYRAIIQPGGSKRDDEVIAAVEEAGATMVLHRPPPLPALAAPMEPIGAGRASRVYDLGGGRVLRRGGVPGREARVMEHARLHGYPTPRVLEVQPDALVLERVEGPTMLAELQRRPSALSSHACLLADLHARLHAIEAPAGLADAGRGDRLLHLDLHPDNVILSPAGPSVIDWTNARRGEPALDVALTWVILATSAGDLGYAFVELFLDRFDREQVVDALPAAAARRIADPNVTDDERRSVEELVRRSG